MRKASSQVQSERSAERDGPPRDRHGFRGLPPPATFDFDALPDSALLSETDVAAILRLSTNTVGSWRQQPAHALRWLALPNGFVRYTAAALRAYLAGGKPRRKKPPARPAELTPPAPPRKRRRPRKAGDPPTAQEQAP